MQNRASARKWKMISRKFRKLDVRKTDKKFGGRVCGITYKCLMFLSGIDDDQIAFKNFVDMIVDPVVAVTGQDKRHLDKVVAVIIVLIGKACSLPGKEKGRI